MRKLTQEFVEHESRKRGILIKDTYVGANFPMKAECTICGHPWPIRWHDIQAGYGCPRCAGLAPLTQEFVEKESLKRRILIKDTYKNANTPMVSECLICLYEWRICWNSIQQGRGCPSCSNQKSKPEQEIFEFVKSLYVSTENRKRGLLTNKRFELDIYIPQFNKAIEFDGPRHDPKHKLFSYKTLSRDDQKDIECKQLKIDLLRISYKDYMRTNKIWILLCIKEWLSQPSPLISK